MWLPAGGIRASQGTFSSFNNLTFTYQYFCIPGIWRDEMWPDKWTAVTEDGKRSAQFEHTLLVTETGCDILTKRPDKDGQPHFMDKL